MFAKIKWLCDIQTNDLTKHVNLSVYEYWFLIPRKRRFQAMERDLRRRGVRVC